MNGSNRLIDCAQIHDLRVKGHDNLQVRRIRTQRNVSRRSVDATVVPRTVGTNGRQACCIARCMLQASHCCVMCCTFGVPCCILHVACRTLLNLAHCLMLHAACFASHFAQVTQSATLRVALSALSVARHLADPRAPDTWHLRGRAVGDADLVARRHRPAHQHRRPPPRHRLHQRMLLIAHAVRRATGGCATGSWDKRLLGGAPGGVRQHATHKIRRATGSRQQATCSRQVSGLLPSVVQMNAVSSRSHSLFVVTVMQARLTAASTHGCCGVPAACYSMLHALVYVVAETHRRVEPLRPFEPRRPRGSVCRRSAACRLIALLTALVSCKRWRVSAACPTLLCAIARCKMRRLHSVMHGS